MANALDAVLELRRQEQAQQEAQSQALTQAATIFMQARQLKQQEQLKKLELAQEQQKMLQEQNDPLNQLIKKGKVAEAAKSLGDRNLWNQITGNQPANPVSEPIKSASETVNPTSVPTSDLSQYLNEIDPFTQKPTARAEQAKVALELQKKDAEPLGADATARFSGAVNGIDNINQIIDSINSYEGNKKDLVYQANLEIEAQGAKDVQFLGGALPLPGMKAAYVASKRFRTSPESQGLANNFATLAENILRARTGAAAPEPEMVREYARTLFKTFLENPKQWNQKIKNEYQFLKTTHDEIRPLRKDQAQLKGEIKPFNDSTSKTVFNSPVEIIGKDVGELSTGLLEAAKNPKGTLSSLGSVAGGLLQKIPGSPLGTILKNVGGSEDRDTAANALIGGVKEKYGSPRKILESFSKKPVSTSLDLSPFAFAGGKLLKSARTASESSQLLNQASKRNLIKDIVTRNEGTKTVNSLLGDVKEKILSKGGYVDTEHKFYANSLDKIKGTTDPIKDASDVLNNFSSTNRNVTTNAFPTTEMEKVYSALSDKLNTAGKLTEEDVVNAIRILKGKFGSGKVDSSKRLNLNAAQELSKSLLEENQKVLKVANVKYSQFKKNENDINDLVGMWDDAKGLDSKINTLLTKDLGPNQALIAKFIKEKTGIDVLHTINRYRGINQIKNAFPPIRYIDNLRSGIEKVIKSKKDK